MRLMSMMYGGVASLNFIIGIRLCPPDRILASWPNLPSSDTASSSVLGAKYSKLRGIMESSLGTSLLFLNFSTRHSGRRVETQLSIYFRRARGVNYGVGGKCKIVVGSGLAYPRPIASVNS